MRTGHIRSNSVLIHAEPGFDRKGRLVLKLVLLDKQQGAAAGPETDALLEWIRTNFFINRNFVAKYCSPVRARSEPFHIVIPYQ
jgi:hypothetical protein